VPIFEAALLAIALTVPGMVGHTRSGFHGMLANVRVAELAQDAAVRPHQGRVDDVLGRVRTKLGHNIITIQNKVPTILGFPDDEI
jgi:hypothetical protein